MPVLNAHKDFTIIPHFFFAKIRVLAFRKPTLRPLGHFNTVKAYLMKVK
jgi:hypothetical protein